MFINSSQVITRKISIIFIGIFAVLLFCCSQETFGQNFFISGGNNYSTALCADGKILVWGANNQGQRGNSTASGPGQITIPSSNIKQVDAGSGSTGIAVGCNGEVWTWGDNSSGQIGNGSASTTNFVTTPYQVKAVGGIGFLSDINYVNASTSNSYAIKKSSGEIFAWGLNDKGQLGNGTFTNENYPVYVKTTGNINLTKAIQVEGGDENGYAIIDPDGDGIGTVYSWGANTGQFGGTGMLGRDSVNNGVSNNNIALPVIRADNGKPLDNIISISAGDTHCMALDANGNVWSWGNDSWKGQVGSGNAGRSVFKAIKVAAGSTNTNGDIFLSKVVSITAGQSFSMAVLSSGEVVVWGGLDKGTEYDFIKASDPSGNTSGKVTVPVYLLDANGNRVKGIKSVSDGDFWAFLIGNDGKLSVVGYGPNGELGVSNTLGTKVPIPLPLPECTVAEPCPIANLGKDRTKCISETIMLYGGSSGSTYTYTWYLNGTLLTTGSGVGPLAPITYLATEYGTYKVVIKSATNNTCGVPCQEVTDEIVISQVLPPPSPKATYCNGIVTPDTIGMGPNKKYQWFRDQNGGTALGNPIDNPTGFSNVGLSVVGNDTIVYVSETSSYHGIVGPNKSIFIGNGEQKNPNAVDVILRTSKEISLKFDASSSFTLDSMTIGYGAYSSVGSKNLVINIRDRNNNIIGTTTALVNCTASGIYYSKLYLGIKIPAGTGYTIDAVGSDASLNIVWFSDGAPNWFPRQYSLNGNLVANNFINQYYTPDPNNTYSKWASPAFFDWVVSSSNYYPCGRIPVKITKNCPACTKPISFAFSSSATNNCNSGAANSITLTVGAVNPTAPADGTAYLYQWYKNNTAIALETTKIFTVTSNAALVNGTYSVRVGNKSVDNASGCYLDSSRVITFEDPIANNKIFQTDTICAGSTPKPLIAGTVPTGGKPALTYQWQSSTTAGGPYTTIVGAIAATFAPGATSATTYFKRQVVSGGVCPPNLSDSAIVVADPALIVSTIRPQSPTICQFNAPVITETVPSSGGRGVAEYKYIWKVDSSLTAPDEWKVLLNADNDSLLNAPRLSGIGEYKFRRIIVSGKCTDSSEVTVTTIPGMNPGIIATDQNICYGTTPAAITSTALASGGTGASPTYTYQWMSSVDGINFTDIPGQTNPAGYAPGTLTASVFIARRAAVVGSTSPCDAGATGVEINVYDDLNPGTIKADTTLCAGGQLTIENLTPFSGGSPDKAYRWDSSATGTAPWIPIRNGGSSINFNSGKLNSSVYYQRVTIDANCGSVVSNTYKVTVVPVKIPKVTAILPNGTVCELDRNVRFEADTTGAGNNGKFEWYLNGTLQTQSTADSIRLSNWTPPTAQIRVKVIPDRAAYPCYAADDDSTLVVQVTQQLTPTVSLNTIQPICEGQPLLFTAITSPSSATDRLVWKLDGAVIPTAANNLTYQSSTLRNNQIVSVEFESGSACATTPNAAPASRTVTVYAQPRATTTPDQAATICSGKDFTMIGSGNFAGAANNVTYQWYKDGTKIPAATNATFIAKQAGIYNVEIITGGLCKDTSNPVPLQVQQLDVNAGLDKVMYKGDPAIILNGSLQLNGTPVADTQPYTITWVSQPQDPSFVLDAEKLSPSVAPGGPTTYIVTAISALGCRDSDQVNVIVYLPIRVPNAFSPNGDGLNDTWVIEGLFSYPKAKVQVYNRWGSIVYESVGYPQKSATGWDGTKGGVVVPVATYYYIVDPQVDSEPVRTGYLVIVK